MTVSIQRWALAYESIRQHRVELGQLSDLIFELVDGRSTGLELEHDWPGRVVSEARPGHWLYGGKLANVYQKLFSQLIPVRRDHVGIRFDGKLEVV